MPPSPATATSWYLPSISWPMGFTTRAVWLSRDRAKRSLAVFSREHDPRGFERRHRGLPPAGQLLELFAAGLIVAEQLGAARRVVVNGRICEPRRAGLLPGVPHRDPLFELCDLLLERPELRRLFLTRLGLAALA